MRENEISLIIYNRKDTGHTHTPCIVVLKTNGDPNATAQARAVSVAVPLASLATAKEALIPAPFLDLPCFVPKEF